MHWGPRLYYVNQALLWVLATLVLVFAARDLVRVAPSPPTTLAAEPAADLRHAVATARLFTGLVTVYGDGRILRQGSGFFLDTSGLFLTARHVLGDQQMAEIQLENSTPRAARLVAASEALDLSILQVLGGGAFPAGVLRITPPVVPGEMVGVLGYPVPGLLADSMTARSGIVASVSSDRCLIALDEPASPGQSGGPMIDLQGRVVGMVTGRFTYSGGEGVDLAFALRPTALGAALYEVQTAKRQDPAPFGLKASRSSC